MVFYMAPIANLDAWMKKPEAERKSEEEKMMKEWNEWMAANKGLASDAAGLGKTKRVTKGAVADARNDMMLYSIAEGESQEEVANAFKNHPHFGIPGAWIDVVAMNPMNGKAG